MAHNRDEKLDSLETVALLWPNGYRAYGWKVGDSSVFLLNTGRLVTMQSLKEAEVVVTSVQPG